MDTLGIEPLSLALQIMMATSLAACAGLRAWLPLLAVGVLARVGIFPLAESFRFLASWPALIVFGIATIVELVGDKVLAVDHALDAVSTFVRPVAGTVLAAASLTQADPLFATVAGLVIGGGAALTVHSGKAIARAKTTSLAMFHGGTGNAAVSFLEDGAVLLGTGLAVAHPMIAFALAVLVLVLASLVIYAFIRTGRHVMSLLLNRPDSVDAPHPVLEP